MGGGHTKLPNSSLTTRSWSRGSCGLSWVARVKKDAGDLPEVLVQQGNMQMPSELHGAGANVILSEPRGPEAVILEGT